MHHYAPVGEQRTRILAGIRSGGYPRVAAAAFGMCAEEFDACMSSANLPDSPESVRSFAREASEAHAQARLRAEIAVFEDDPKIWLEHGPGRETRRSPGWTQTVKPCATAPEDSNALADEAMVAIVHAAHAHIKDTKLANDLVTTFTSVAKTTRSTFKESPNVLDFE